MKILYCRIGWMNSYNGLYSSSGEIKDSIVNGGAYNKDNIGHEIYNFSNNNGTYYGYVSNSINLNRLDNSIKRNTDFIEGVLVIWIATDPRRKGQFIIGWYNNAIVYKKVQYVPNEIIKNRIKSIGSDYNEYYIKSNDVVLVKPNMRSEQIFGLGESNIWYGNEDTNKRVLEYINEYNNNIFSNISEIEKDTKELSGDEKETIVKTRINQSFFRKQLLHKYNKCYLCGLENQNLLIASHIKPWHNSNPSEKVSENNGLLLCPNHDKIFDIGLISFNDNGKILISNSLSQIDRLLLNIREDMKIDVTSDNIEFIKYHRNNIFKE